MKVQERIMEGWVEEGRRVSAEQTSCWVDADRCNLCNKTNDGLQMVL